MRIITPFVYTLALHMKRATYQRHENHEQLDADMMKTSKNKTTLWGQYIAPPIPTLTERVK